MTSDEQNAWKRFMMTSAGHWTVDPIHNGVDRDLIVFAGLPADPEQGIYVAVEKDGAWHTGSYAEASPHIADGVLRPRKQGKAGSYDAAIKLLIEGLGLAFLLSLTHGRSPYRTL